MKSALLCYASLIISVTYSVKAQDSSDTYVLSPDNTKIEFNAKHFGVINVYGTFKSFRGQIFIVNEIVTTAEITLNVSSLTTNNSSRDKSLKGKEFLDLEGYPTVRVTFQNNTNPTIIESFVGIKGLINSVPINYETIDKDGETKMIKASCEISRKQFRLNLGSMDDLVSDKVAVTVFVTIKVK